ncbi:MAG: PLP-dependent aminotransferase family protein [Microthrixaceae bacterium]|nr:PLP-dependent aminotransferase family protein [Microthrixaceae bacterium]
MAPRVASLRSSFIRDLLASSCSPGVLSLAGGLPGDDLIPVEAVDRAARRVLAGGSAALNALQYGATEGAAELRDVLGERLGVSGGEVIVTTGSQQGIDLVSRCLLEAGDVVVVESPTYLGSLQAFRAQGARVEAIEGDRWGLDIGRLADALSAGLRPRLVSVVSEFANPSGATLSPERRRALVDLARRYRFVILDDNPYGELRWSGTSPVGLEEIAATSADDGRNDCVVSLGSASKILAPGLRVGWLRAPEEIRRSVVTLKQATDLQTSSLDQRLVAELLGDADWIDAHLATARETYQRRCSVLLDAVLGGFGDAVDVDQPDGGMFLWVRFNRSKIDTMELFRRSIELGVAFVPGEAFGSRSGRSHAMRLCFATLKSEELRTAVRRLVRAAQPML